MEWDPWKRDGDVSALDKYGEARVPPRDEYRRAGVYAYHGHVGTNAVVEEHYNYPGSPPPAFGLTTEEYAASPSWPCVTARCALPTGRLDLREALGKRLRDTIDAFLKEHGLDGLGDEPEK